MQIYTFARNTECSQTLQHVRPTGKQPPIVTTVVNTGIIGFTKPDEPVRNVKAADGYRKPSGYFCNGFGAKQDRLDITKQNRYPRVFSLKGKWYVPSTRPGYGSEYTVEGDAIAQTPAGGQYVTDPFPTTINPNQIRTKVLNNIRDEVLDVAMVLAEMQSTATTLGNNLYRVARSMNAIRKRKPESFSYLMHGRRRDNRRPTDKFLRETAGTFMEWKYGIMPTVYDIEGATRAFDMNEDGSFWDNPPLLVARASEVRQGVTSLDYSFQGPGAGGVLQKVPAQYRMELKARCDYSVTGEGLRGLNRYGLGLSTIPTILFERTPFSFVLNMAVPIADIVKAWSALAGCDVRGYSETLYREMSFPAFKTSYKSHGGGIVEIEAPATADRHYFDFRRDAFGTVPMPLPFVRNPIKTGNLATVLALFTQLRKPDARK